jgi:prevent-host-death family protein
MQSVSLTEAKANFADLLQRVTVGKERIFLLQDGEPCAAVVPIRDLSATRAGRAVAETGETLEAQVRERTAALHQANRELQDLLDQHKQVEEALVESELLCGTILDAIPAAINVKDGAGRYLLSNRNHAALHDLCPEEVAGKTVRELLTAAGSFLDRQYADVVLERDSQVLASGQPMGEFEEWATDRDGQTVCWLTAKIPLRDGEGRYGRVLTVSRNITQRKRAEESLRESRDQIRLIADNLPVLIAYLDRDERYRFANLAHERYLERPLSEILGRTAAGVLEAPIYEKLRPHIAKVMAGEKDRFDVTAELADEPPRHFHLNLIPHVGDDDQVQGFFALVRDITRRTQTEEIQRENEERLRQATRLAKLGHCVWDAVADKCIYCSEEHARIHGLSVEEYIARSSGLAGGFALTHPEDRERYRKACGALRQGRGFDMEYRVISPDGDIRHVREIAEPVFDDRGTVVQEHVTMQDITDMKQAEAQLRQAQKMEAVGELTGGVAHDFNNMLSVILGNADLLSDELGKDDTRIQTLLRAATRGAELTSKLLAFSRKQRLQPQAVDVDGLVDGMSDLLRRTLGETIEIRTVSVAGLWRAMADPGQVENAILNLALNARHAMPGGGRLVIETDNASLDEAYLAGHPGAVAGDYVMLAVTDTGSGMTSEVLAHAFEPFFTTKEVGEGSGLGLSMVYGFAKQSGGYVTLHSEAGRGTTVKLYLPRSDLSTQSAGEAATHDVPLARGETVLLVEDDADVRELAANLLDVLGYRVLEAPDASIALKILEGGAEADLILSDIVLPGGMSGVDLAKEVRRENPGVKFLFMSGYAEKALPLVGLTGEELLSKPFRKHELAQKLRAALESPT